MREQFFSLPEGTPASVACSSALASNLSERRVRLFRNGRSQAVRIPREFKLQETEAVMRRLAVVKGGIAALLASWEPLDDDFPEPEDLGITPEDIFWAT